MGHGSGNQDKSEQEEGTPAQQLPFTLGKFIDEFALPLHHIAEGQAANVCRNEPVAANLIGEQLGCGCQGYGSHTLINFRRVTSRL